MPMAPDKYETCPLEIGNTFDDVRVEFNMPSPRGGGTWVFRGVHTFVIKIKKYPKALISG